MGVRSVKAGNMLAWDRVEAIPAIVLPVGEVDPSAPTPPSAARSARLEQARSLLMGHVTLLEDEDAPVHGAVVVAGPRSCVTDADGLYRLPLDDLEIPVTVSVTAPGYFRRVEPVDWSSILSGGLLLRDFQLVEDRLAPPTAPPGDGPVIECPDLAETHEAHEVLEAGPAGLEAGAIGTTSARSAAMDLEPGEPGTPEAGHRGEGHGATGPEAGSPDFRGLDRLELPMWPPTPTSGRDQERPVKPAPETLWPENTEPPVCSLEALSATLNAGAYVPPAGPTNTEPRLARGVHRLVATLLEPAPEALDVGDTDAIPYRDLDLEELETCGPWDEDWEPDESPGLTGDALRALDDDWQDEPDLEPFIEIDGLRLPAVDVEKAWNEEPDLEPSPDLSADTLRLLETEDVWDVQADLEPSLDSDEAAIAAVEPGRHRIHETGGNRPLTPVTGTPRTADPAVPPPRLPIDPNTPPTERPL